MATKKKTEAKKTAPKKAADKKAPAKKTAVKGKRYTQAEKDEVLAFVAREGRGGQTKAAAKFGVSALTISNWRKKAGKPAGSSKAPKAPKAPRMGAKVSDPWSQMVALKSDIDQMERKLEAKKVELRKLAAQL